MATIAEQILALDQDQELPQIDQAERLLKSIQVIRTYEKLKRERRASQSKPFLTPASAPVYAAVLALIGAAIGAGVLAYAYGENFKTQRAEAKAGRIMDVIKTPGSQKEFATRLLQMNEAGLIDIPDSSKAMLQKVLQ